MGNYGEEDFPNIPADLIGGSGVETGIPNIILNRWASPPSTGEGRLVGG